MSRSTLDRRCSVHFLANDGACEAPTVSERRLPIMNVSYKPSFTTPPPGSTGGGKEEEDDEGVERVAAPSPESLLLWLQRAGLATTAPARPVGPQYRVRQRTAPSERLRDDSTVMHISSAIDGRCLIVSNRRRVNSRSKKVIGFDFLVRSYKNVSIPSHKSEVSLEKPDRDGGRGHPAACSRTGLASTGGWAWCESPQPSGWEDVGFRFSR